MKFNSCTSRKTTEGEQKIGANYREIFDVVYALEIYELLIFG